MIRVLFAEDHKLVRNGILSLLDTDQDIEVVAEAADGEEAKTLLMEQTVDVALLDIEMPKLNGLQLTQYIKKNYPAIKVLILSMYKNPQYINAAINKNADGYILKDSADQEELILAIKNVADGRIHFGNEVMNIQVMAQREDYKKGQEKIHLTRREKEVLELIADGMTTKAISSVLHIEDSTIETHRRNLLHKLKAKNSLQLVRKTIEGGYLN